MSAANHILNSDGLEEESCLDFLKSWWRSLQEKKAVFLETKVENIKIKTSYLYPEADSLITDSVKLLLVFIHYLENYILVLISFFSLIHFLMKKIPKFSDSC